MGLKVALIHQPLFFILCLKSLFHTHVITNLQSFFRIKGKWAKKRTLKFPLVTRTPLILNDLHACEFLHPTICRFVLHNLAKAIYFLNASHSIVKHHLCDCKRMSCRRFFKKLSTDFDATILLLYVCCSDSLIMGPRIICLCSETSARHHCVA